jgi:hypothetical protein
MTDELSTKPSLMPILEGKKSLAPETDAESSALHRKYREFEGIYELGLSM